ncbi:MAG: transporter [Gemmatimonadota bacterium]|nr:transporter [Gemmatimonadota bacterium]
MIGLTMTPVLATTLRYAIIPVVFTIVGAAAGVYFPLLARLRSHVLHLAAGVVFAVVAVELLPEIQRRALVWDVVWGFGLGIVTMLAVDKILDRIRGDDDQEVDATAPGGDDAATHPSATGLPRTARIPVSLLVAVAIDFLLDGVLVGVGFAAGARIGILLALAEAAEQLSVGLALAGELRTAGMTRGRILSTITALGSLVFVSAVAGATVLSGLPDGAMEIVLSFGAAALLYLVTEELLREAHEERESTSGTAMFFVGFLVFLVIGMTLG